MDVVAAREPIDVVGHSRKPRAEAVDDGLEARVQRLVAPVRALKTRPGGLRISGELRQIDADGAPRPRWAGPTRWAPPAPTPPWLDELEGPIVLVTTSGDYQGDTDIARVALMALADEPVSVVATIPGDAPLGFEPPANARITRFLPHSAVLERAVCAVTHGGMGVTQKALGAAR